MLVVLLLVASLVLVGFAHVLRRPPHGLWRGALGFAVGFFAVAAMVHWGSMSAGIVRKDLYARVAADALSRVKANPDPYVLFVGASYSRNALDDARMTRRLQADGHHLQVINFSMQGASLQERNLRLKQFMAAAPRPPEMVFLEISDEFDRSPTYGFTVAKFSNRVFGQFNLPNSIWAVRGLWEERCHFSTKDKLEDSVLLGLHLPVNLLNVGLLSGGDWLKDIKPLKSWDPQEKPRSVVTADARNTGLLAPYDKPAAKEPLWAKEFRARQANWLHAHGVTRIGYYFPPVVSPALRAYAAARCKEYSPCIAPTDLELLAKLDKNIWFDDEHLLAKGGEIYTDWLANKIQADGALNPPDHMPRYAKEEGQLREAAQ